MSKYFLVCALVVLFTSSSRGQNQVWEEALPLDVVQLLQSKYPEGQLPERADYAGMWWALYDVTHIPYAVSTDINDDIRVDHFCLLKMKGSLILAAVVSNTEDFEIFELRRWKPGDKIQHGLTVQPPGRLDVMTSGDRSLILASNGIVIYNLERPASVYFWSKINRAEMFTEGAAGSQYVPIPIDNMYVRDTGNKMAEFVIE